MKREKLTKGKKAISASDFDKKFDSGESIMEHLDLDSATFRVNVDFPKWMIGELDKEATRLGITRQALIKVWIAERLDSLSQNRKRVVGEKHLVQVGIVEPQRNHVAKK